MPRGCACLRASVCERFVCCLELPESLMRSAFRQARGELHANHNISGSVIFMSA